MNPDEYAASLGGVAVEDDPDAFAQSLGGVAVEDDPDEFARSLGATVAGGSDPGASPGPLDRATEEPPQPLPETALNQMKRGFLDLAAKPLQAIGNTQQAAVDLAGQAPFIGPTWKRALEMLPSARMAVPFVNEVVGRRAEMSPVDPRNKWTAGIAGAVPTVMGLAATGGMAGAPAALGLAGAMGAQSGFETADEIGVTSPAGKLALAGGFGAAEAGIEALGGLGAKPVIGSALKRFAKTARSEAIEEPLTGGAQDLITRLAATEDPSNPGFTATGYDLAQLNPTDPRYLNKRLLEAGIGVAGGTLAGGLAALPQPASPASPASPSFDIPHSSFVIPPPPPPASVTPPVSPVPTPAAAAEAPVIESTDAGSTPAAGASSPQTTVQPPSTAQSAPQQPSTSPSGPGAAAATEYAPSAALKNFKDRFVAWTQADPLIYRRSPEAELDSLSKQMLDENEAGLEAVTNELLTTTSADLGLKEREHIALLGNAMLKWEARAMAAENAGTTDAEGTTAATFARTIFEQLQSKGSDTGQNLQAFSYLQRRDPLAKLRTGIAEVETKREEAVTTKTGMSPQELEAEIKRRVAEELAKQPGTTKNPVRAQLSAADAILKRLAPKVRVKRDSMNRLVKTVMDASAAGILSRPDFLAAFESAFGIKNHLTPQLITTLKQKAVAARALPAESTERRELEQDIADDLTIASGLKTSDLVRSGWYGNILSGLGTQAMNIKFNAMNMTRLVAQATSDMLSGDMTGFARMMSGGWRGTKAGLAGGLNTWNTGRAFKGGTKFGDVTKSELAARGWQTLTPVQKAVYIAMAQGVSRRVMRFMSAADVAFHTLARESAAAMAAGRKLRKQGMKPGTAAFRAAYAKEMGMESTQWAGFLTDAAAQLKASGKSANRFEVTRRAVEMATASRPEDVTAAAKRLGDRVTGQQDPEGSGRLFSGILTGIQRVPILGKNLTPFNKIVSNFASENLDWTGIGLVRAALGQPVTQALDRALGRQSKSDVRYDQTERIERAIIATAGLGMGMAAYGIAQAFKDLPDDDEMPTMVYGYGPEGKNERATWLAAGNRPFSIRRGAEVTNYSETPMAFPLAIVGSIMDKERYGKKQEVGEERAALGLFNGVKAIFHFGPLGGTRKIIEMLEGRMTPKNVAVQLSGASGLIPMSGAMRDLENLIDPTRTSDETIAGMLMAGVPGMSSKFDARLDRFGRNIVDSNNIVRRVNGTNELTDPVIKFMLKHDLRIPGAAEVTRWPDGMALGSPINGETPSATLDRRGLELDRLNKMHLTSAEERTFRQTAGRYLYERLGQLKTQIETREQAGESIRDSSQIQKMVQAIDKEAELRAKRELMERVP